MSVIPVNYTLCYSKEEVAAFTQIQRTKNDDKSILWGDNEAYIFVVPANSARRLNLKFSLHEQELPPDKKEFDELILTYFDEKNNVHAFYFAKPKCCWVEGELEIIKQWITLDKKYPYAR